MSVAEFAADFDGRQVGSQMIALGHRAGTLKIQLSRESMIYLHAVQREIALVGVRFREAARSPLGEIEVLGVGQLILAGTRWQTVGVKRCSAIADLADLAGTRRGEVPGIPGSGEHVLATEQDTPTA